MFRLLIPLLWIRDIYRDIRHIRRMRRIERERIAVGLTSSTQSLSIMQALAEAKSMTADAAPKAEQPPPYSSRDITRDYIASVGDWVVIDLPLDIMCISPMFCGPLYNPLYKVVTADESCVEARIAENSTVRLKHGQYGVYKPGRDNYSTSYGFIPLKQEEAKHA